MDEHDRKNLDFLIKVSQSPELFKDWYDSLSPDDIDYAYELLLEASEEIEHRSEELVIEAKLDAMNGKYPDAERLLKNIMKT